MKKLVLAVALAVSNIVCSQTLSYQSDICLSFYVSKENLSNFELKTKNDIDDLLNNRNIIYDNIIFGNTNNITINKKELTNITTWYYRDTVIQYNNIQNYIINNNILSFSADGTDRESNEKYKEYFIFDLNQINNVNANIDNTFGITYWYNNDGSISGQLLKIKFINNCSFSKNAL